ncbi:hypothetical protein Poli38472_004258 [Pythium oligandrum]|uniref:CDP-alcohol phosphatidyltransferase n=1 Tax=Pythium oligandrum TaxID=41045 RepID=A0A8K1FQD3_PYTOL|nr:hypothetical protein Poli38472_004258 [Pythium oligandrum]|eukprot:TMW66493.1 hypothetical protein Poli38472_004258 [Pythium oligandrum]
MTMLSKKALEGIASYKYKAGSYTFIDNQLNVFWTAAVELLPTWMAPNLVTMVGTCAMLFTTIVQLFVSPHLSEPAPFWVYLLSAVGLFFYQTMDALDGKQARRTGASSPLGQLFDHGCDAFCTIINVLSAAATVQLGSEVLTYVAISSVSITFYMAQWEEYHTGVMSCGNGWYGVTEGQLTLVAVHLLTAVVGPAFWTIVLPVPFVSITPAHVLVMALIGSNIILVSGNVLNVIRTPLEAMSAEEAGAKHRAKPVAMFQLVPISILVVLGYFWVSGPNVADYKAYPLLFLFPYGIAFVFFSTRMIVSHMCKVPFTPQLRVLIPFGLLILNTYGPTLGLFPKPLLRPLLATVLYGLGITCIYLHYVVHVVYDISCYLNIYVFKIKMKQ